MSNGGEISLPAASEDLAQSPDGRLVRPQSSRGAPADNRRSDKYFTAARTNLGRQLSSLIGREHELAMVHQLLSSTPLLTLVGAGGVGKTRLALAAAADVLGTRMDGAWLVELAALSDPELVADAVATTLGIRSRRGVALSTSIARSLKSRRVLLVLDNCEHLIDACAELVDALLRACRDLQILATSREPLRVPGEVVFRVPSLELSDRSALWQADDLEKFGATRLFLARVRAALPSFEPSDSQASAIARICQRLDGIPLAIELAATQMVGLSPETIADRLDDRFQLLTLGSRTAPRRQQTLRATLDWSYHLLGQPEQQLLARLSVFAGGWSSAAAQAVCATAEPDATALLGRLLQLVNKSLVVVEFSADGSIRYTFLETIRQYAADRLVEQEQDMDVAALRQRHARYFAEFFASAALRIRSPDQARWFARFDEEQANARAAMAWSLLSYRCSGRSAASNAKGERGWRSCSTRQVNAT